MSDNIVLRNYRSLNIRQRKAAVMIAEGRKYSEVCREIKCAPSTLAQWRGMPEFQMILRMWEMLFVDESFNTVNNMIPGVLENLRDLAYNAARDSDKINASKVLVTGWHLLKESRDRDFVDALATRVSLLESVAAREEGYDDVSVLRSLEGLDAAEVRELEALSDGIVRDKSK